MNSVKNNLNTQHDIRGFTLVEVLVSLAIFTFVVTAAMGTLLVMIDANRKSQNIQSVMTNLSFALDSMTRDIRTGQRYYCQSGTASVPSNSAGLPIDGNSSNSCATGGRSFSFNEGGESLTGITACTNSGSKRIAFRYNDVDKSIERRICDGDDDINTNETGDDWKRITAPEVEVSTLEFVVTGTDTFFSGLSDTQSPTVTIYIDGVVQGKTKTTASFEIQTTITQQLLDI